MAGRLPSSAFEYYAQLGPDRSYTRVAKHFGVTKRTVTQRATKERWQERVRQVELQARAKVEEKLVDSVAAVTERQLKMVRVLQSKALRTLQGAEFLESTGEATRALAFSLKHEREMLGLDDAPEDDEEDDGPPSVWHGESDSPIVAWIHAVESRMYLAASVRQLFELPEWIGFLSARGHHWAEKASRVERVVTDLLDELLGWLDELADEKKIDGRRPIHGQLLQALRGDDERGEKMEKKLITLAEELARHREEAGIEDDDHAKWRLGGFGPDNLEWRDVYADGEGPNDPFAWVVRRLLAPAAV